MPTIQVGKLDQRVTFRRIVKAPDGYGGSTKTTNDVVTVWANVRPLSGREREQGMRPDGVSTYVITIRNSASARALRDTDTAAWRGREFNLRFRRDDGPRPRWLEIEADKGVALG